MKRGLLLLILLLLPLQRLHAQQPSVRVEIVGQSVYVRAAPDGAILGTLRRGALVDVTGASADRAWLYFLYWGKPAWITASKNFIHSYGDLSTLPGVGGSVTLTEYSIVPDVPEPDQPFTIRLTLRASQELGAFQIAGNCAQFAMLAVPRMAADIAQTVDLHCPGDPATGAHTSELVIDTDQQVSQGSKRAIVYFIDRLYTQSAMNWPAFSDLNLDGGKYDLAWDGVNVIALNGARLYALADPSLATIHYDRLLAGELVDRLPSAGVIGVLTAEQQRAVVQVIAERGDHLHIEFRIYPEKRS